MTIKSPIGVYHPAIAWSHPRATPVADVQAALRLSEPAYISKIWYSQLPGAVPTVLYRAVPIVQQHAVSPTGAIIPPNEVWLFNEHDVLIAKMFVE